MQITLVEPFLGGSHRQWAEGWQKYSQHNITLMGLPARHWKWRMHGAAVTLGQQAIKAEEPDIYVVSDMLDLATFKAITRTQRPCLLYFHENQITYPWSPTDEDPKLNRDRHYGWLNYTAALVADGIAFNSHYHKDAFFKALPPFLAGFPDYQQADSVQAIENKSCVLHLGLDLPPISTASWATQSPKQSPVLLWNHRWEYDKNPEAFFRLCEQLKAANQDFKLIVLGQQHKRQPAVFEKARKQFSAQILHWGFVAERKTYWEWLLRADVVPVTSRQDFFGISAVEAMHAGCLPIFPNRLAFPEHLLQADQKQHLYEDEKGLFASCLEVLNNWPINQRSKWSKMVEHYHWQDQCKAYDNWIEKNLAKSKKN